MLIVVFYSTVSRYIMKNNLAGFVTLNEDINFIAEKVVFLIQNDNLRKEFGCNVI